MILLVNVGVTFAPPILFFLLATFGLAQKQKKRVSYLERINNCPNNQANGIEANHGRNHLVHGRRLQVDSSESALGQEVEPIGFGTEARVLEGPSGPIEKGQGHTGCRGGAGILSFSGFKRQH